MGLKPNYFVRSDAMSCGVEMRVKGEVLCEEVTPIPHSDLDVVVYMG